MPKAISNTSPLLYLYRIQLVDWLPSLFDELWTTSAAISELQEGQRRGYDVPDPRAYSWLEIREPLALPSEWLALDLGFGELAVMALALEYPDRVVLLDDALARRIAQAAGLEVWGSLKLLLEAKAKGLIREVNVYLDRLEDAGLWVLSNVRRRILTLAGED